jgi:peptidoglycan-associated lipoprotein
MKLSKVANLMVIGLAATIAATGCKKKPYNVTPLPNPGAKTGPGIREPGSAPPIGTGNPVPQGTTPVESTTTPAKPNEGIPQKYADRHDWPRNEVIFNADTVHFDFDSSVVKSGEKTKVEHVADYLKNNPSNAVEIQGHCDERGTEEYNRALGERRALALREELVRLGIDPNRIDTISYGKDRPEDPGHDETAWAKNRRGVFVLLTPPTQ